MEVYSEVTEVHKSCVLFHPKNPYKYWQSLLCWLFIEYFMGWWPKQLYLDIKGKVDFRRL